MFTCKETWYVSPPVIVDVDVSDPPRPVAAVDVFSFGIASVVFFAALSNPEATSPTIASPEVPTSVQPAPENGPCWAGECGRNDFTVFSTPETAPVTTPTAFRIPVASPPMIAFPTSISHVEAPEKTDRILPSMEETTFTTAAMRPEMNDAIVEKIDFVTEEIAFTAVDQAAWATLIPVVMMVRIASMRTWMNEWIAVRTASRPT
jgi:hypothetical protein